MKKEGRDVVDALLSVWCIHRHLKCSLRAPSKGKLSGRTDSLNYNYFNVSSKSSMYTCKELQWFIDTKHGKHEHSGSKKAERHKIRKAQDKQRLSNADLIPIDHFLETAGSYQFL